MIIRKAKPSDSKIIAPLLFSAMEEIVYAFLGEKNHQKAIDFLDNVKTISILIKIVG